MELAGCRCPVMASATTWPLCSTRCVWSVVCSAAAALSAKMQRGPAWVDKTAEAEPGSSWNLRSSVLLAAFPGIHPEHDATECGSAGGGPQHGKTVALSLCNQTRLVPKRSCARVLCSLGLALASQLGARQECDMHQAEGAHITALHAPGEPCAPLACAPLAPQQCSLAGSWRRPLV
jgi:hypothetical protein